MIELWCEELLISTITKGHILSRKHVGRITTKMGKRLVANYYKSLEKIGGSNIIVEIDESKIGRRYNKGHHIEGVWVIGCVERTANKRIILQKVEKRNFLHINNFMTNFINNNQLFILMIGVVIIKQKVILKIISLSTILLLLLIKRMIASQTPLKVIALLLGKN